MVSQAPLFWWQPRGLKAWALAPFGWAYGRLTARRMRRPAGGTAEVPVICVGNFTVGGAGKTPTAIALARAARARGLTPGFLSRGYGGQAKRATLVDPARDSAERVGDEPLLLAREAMTVVCRKRIEGARRLAENGADLIIMDDGFQSARLRFDLAVLVIDSRRGIGNGLPLPAGPLRAPMAEQIRQLSVLLKIGQGTAADPVVRQVARAGKPVIEANLRRADTLPLQGQRVLAWVGIADPEKFFVTLREAGAEIVETQVFADHHLLTAQEIADLMARAQTGGLRLVTTAKDHVRLAAGPGISGRLLAESAVIEVELAFDDPAAPGRLIDQAMTNSRARLLGAAKA
ncbi:tetraacyldisaccharide 4'-kinase [Xaviernesmea oryzae]|uniref:Tetraacyldisaccharide 4'-kinase n=1 Tax=Xaviernesmea oryzae TaxID=464029 RepID=A0A1Q9ATK2_9HYPH|nr:tetraacyldisaccharide 4'-kinase [Xaviernesmea oryzae]OLP58743.1 tetraacyldisaccharide 4'-kinase [Xaviernesmea oryzae]SEK71168.1 lipid-A-disaccharide kinase [Xaviernesmea oryzae]